MPIHEASIGGGGTKVGGSAAGKPAEVPVAGESPSSASKPMATEKPRVSLNVIQKSCFTRGTLIIGQYGSKRIEEYRSYADVGEACDWVVSRNENNDDCPLVLRRVLQSFERYSHILDVCIHSRIIGTTAEHPFFVQNKGWTTAQELQAGDEVRLMSPGWAKVEEVWETGRYEVVYNLEVEEDHTYFVGGDDWGFAVWAHNARYEVREHTGLDGNVEIRVWDNEIDGWAVSESGQPYAWELSTGTPEEIATARPC